MIGKIDKHSNIPCFYLILNPFFFTGNLGDLISATLIHLVEF